MDTRNMVASRVGTLAQHHQRPINQADQHILRTLHHPNSTVVNHNTVITPILAPLLSNTTPSSLLTALHRHLSHHTAVLLIPSTTLSNPHTEVSSTRIPTDQVIHHNNLSNTLHHLLEVTPARLNTELLLSI
jgi:hypothetical protein